MLLAAAAVAPGAVDAGTGAAQAGHGRAGDDAAPAPQPVVDWMRTQAIPVPGRAAGGLVDGADAARVAALVGTARVVAIGEPAHGAHEPLALRNRWLRTLVERQGFTAIALETGLTESRVLDAYVQGGPGDAAQVARAGFTWGFGRHPENAALLQWLRDHNRDAAPEHKVRLYGIDLSGGRAGAFPDAGIALDEALAYLRRTAPVASRDAVRAAAPLAALFDPARRAGLPPADLQRMEAALGALADWLRRERGALVAASCEDDHARALRNVVVAQQLAEVLRLTPAAAEGAGIPPEAHWAMSARDRAMADNLRWVLEREGEAGRVLLFAHNGHVGDAVSKGGVWRDLAQPPRMMGSHLRQALGADYLAVATVSARNAGGLPPALPQPHGLEAALARTGLPAFLLDLRGAPPPAAGWLARERPVRANFDTEMWLAPGAAFDAVLFVDVLHPAGAAPSAAAPGKVDFQWGVEIPMRDGVRLSATAYTPRAGAPAPCLFTLTPYIAQSYHDRGMYFAANGYPFLAVDVRGRGNSEGEFEPYAHDAEDGHDVVEWLAKQPYCNGKVAMWGGSYAGFNQWLVAKTLPPSLATIVPAAAPYAGVDIPFRGNIAHAYEVQWLTLVGGRAAQDAVFDDAAFWRSRYREFYESGRPFDTLDAFVGNPSKVFQEWISHPHPDAYWDRLNPAAEQYARMRLPILTITGSHDGDQPGALRHYREHLRNAPPAERARHLLVIGPWDHAGTRTPRAEFGGLKLGPASLVDLGKLHLDWYRWTLQDGPRPEFLKKNVAYYVMGAEKWRYADTLEGVTAESRPYYLDSDGDASDVFASGRLAATPADGGADRYHYDPNDLSMAAIDALPAPQLTDQRRVLAGKGRQLVYHTAPFARPTEVSGFFRLSAWIGIDQPDTDFHAAVYEITADGGSIKLSDAQMRARYRQDVRKPVLVKDDRPLQYEFEDFTFVSRQLRAGSRLRLVLAPVDSIYHQRNYNTGGEVARESRAQARPVTVTLYHGAGHPSALYVPIGRPAPF